jgi:HK97 family phage portal protein
MNINPLTWFRKGASIAPSFYGQTTQPPIDWLTYKKRFSEADFINFFRDTVYYCANLNARGVARTKLCLYQKSATGERRNGKPVKKVNRIDRARIKAAGYAEEDDLEEVTDHPFLDLLDKPFLEDGVAVMGRFTFLEITQLYLETVGRAYWLIDKGKRADGSLVEEGQPFHLYPLIANNVEAYKKADSERFVDEYRYYTGREQLILSPKDVVPFLCPSLANPYTGGHGPLQAAAERLGVSLSYLSQTQSILNNRCRPDAVIGAKAPGDVISEPTRERLEQWYKANFSRTGIGGLLVADVPVEVTPLQYALKDLGELRDEENAIKQIARIYDIPISMLDKDANLASASEGRKQHAYDALTPRLKRIEHAINAHLMPRYDASGRLFVMFDEPYKEPLAPDPTQVAALVIGGIFTADEAREMFGWGPMDEKDKAELDQRRQDELNAKKPPMKPGGKEPASSSKVMELRYAIRNGRPVNCNGKH